MKIVNTIYAQPPGILADFRNDIEARINRHNADAQRLVAEQDELNAAIRRQKAPVPPLHRIVKGIFA